MASIPVGANGSFTLVVTAEHLANRFKDATLPPVLATPVMIMAMENAALNAIKPLLKELSRPLVPAPEWSLTWCGSSNG
jgi:fluoroacetyl-CoA thioesterase